MSLSDEQKRIICESVTDLLNFAEDDQTFYQQEASLMDALTRSVDKNHEFYWLRQCLFNPCVYLKAIASQGGLVTIGEVQEFLIQYILQTLKNTNKPLQAWNETEIYKQFVNSDLDKPFIARPFPIEPGIHPLTLPVLDNKIYTQTLTILNEEIKTVPVDSNEGHSDSIESEVELLIDDETFIPQKYAAVIVQMPLDGKHWVATEPLVNIPTQFTNDAQEDQFLENLKLKAQATALESATILVQHHLTKKYALDDRYVDNIFANTTLKEIVTTRYYFNLLNKGSLSLATFATITQEQMQTLIYPSIIALLQKNIISLKYALTLSPPEKQIITHFIYFSLLMKNTISLYDIHGINQKQVSCLFNPHIINLIQREKIRFAEAKAIPTHLMPIITHTIYSAFFEREIIDWSVLQKISYFSSPLLLHSYVAEFITNKILSLREIANILHEYTQKHAALFQLFTTGLAKRAFALCLGKPFELSHGTDDLDSLQYDLARLACECNQDLKHCYEITLFELSLLLRNEIEKRCRKLPPDDACNMQYSALLAITLKQDKSNLYTWTEVFADLKEAALKCDVENLSLQTTRVTTNTLFANGDKTQKQTNVEQLKLLCEGLIALEKLNPFKQEARTWCQIF